VSFRKCTLAGWRSCSQGAGTRLPLVRVWELATCGSTVGYRAQFRAMSKIARGSAPKCTLARLVSQGAPRDTTHGCKELGVERTFGPLARGTLRPASL